MDRAVHEGGFQSYPFLSLELEECLPSTGPACQDHPGGAQLHQNGGGWGPVILALCHQASAQDLGSPVLQVPSPD